MASSIHKKHDVFLSYSRLDDKPIGGAEVGWVTAFSEQIVKRHQAYSGRALKVFLDGKDIDDNDDWRGRLKTAMRESKIFLAFLSQNYIASKNCRWEWVEYLRHEHSLARGNDGIAPIFFTTIPGMPGSENDPEAIRLRKQFQGDQEIAGWVDDVERELGRRNVYLDQSVKKLNPKAAFDLRPWFQQGATQLIELDLQERLGELRLNPRGPEVDSITLASRVGAIDQRIAARLDRMILADLTPYNIGQSYEHFVGRREELCELHRQLVEGGDGTFTAIHGPGGLGKTAIALQYAHAYAEFYATGGTWQLNCESQSDLGEVLKQLQGFPELSLSIPKAEKRSSDEMISLILSHLKQFSNARITEVRSALERHPDRNSHVSELPAIEKARCLLILDNVDQVELMSAANTAMLNNADWLEVIVTTRLNPNDFGVGNERRTSLEVKTLPLTESVELIREFQPAKRFANQQEESAALELVTELGGFTLAVELVAAHLGRDQRENSIELYLENIRKRGIGKTDEVARNKLVAGDIRHQDKQLSIIMRDTIGQLSHPARVALQFVSLMQSDTIPLAWIARLVLEQMEVERSWLYRFNPLNWPETFGWKNKTEEVLSEKQIQENVYRELRGRRLLNPASLIRLDDRGVEKLPDNTKVHRLVSEHVAAIERFGVKRRLDAIQMLLLNVGVDSESEQIEGSGEWQRKFHRALFTQVLYQLRKHPSPVIASPAVRLAEYELRLGGVDRVIPLLKTAHEELEKYPGSDWIERNLTRAKNFYAEALILRGQSGDGPRAKQLLDESLAIRKEIVTRNPKDEGAKDSVEVVESRIRRFNMIYDPESRQFGSDDKFRSTLERIRPKWEAGRSDADAGRSVSVSCNQYADFLFSRNKDDDRIRAMDLYKEALTIRREVLKLRPESVQAKRDLSLCLMAVHSALFIETDDNVNDERLLEILTEALQIREEILAGAPKSREAVIDVTEVMEDLGVFYCNRNRIGDATRGKDMFESALEKKMEIVNKENLSSDDTAILTSSYMQLSMAYQQLGDDQGAFHAGLLCYRLLEETKQEGGLLSAHAEGLRQNMRPTFHAAYLRMKE